MFKARDAALIAMFAALTAVLGLPGALSPFGASVPITLQSLGPMLAGAILGWKRATASAIVFLLLVAIGLPLLAGGRGGLGVFVGPSAGYLFGWIAGTAVIGALVQARLPRFTWWWTAVSILIGGIGVVYLLGVPVLAMVTKTDGLMATAAAAAVYLPGDLVKVVIATTVAVGVHRAYPDLLPGLRARVSQPGSLPPA
ncbi:MAG: biotin transporter BioY [Actinomycetales bacterium]|nr:biotin transporter BioY [Actinomycetales bacterium]